MTVQPPVLVTKQPSPLSWRRLSEAAACLHRHGEVLKGPENF